MRYNGPMTQPRRLWVLVLLALVVALVVTLIVMWQRGVGHEGVPVAPGTSPLAVPSAAEAPPSPSLSGLAAALFWVVLGGLLALGVAFLVLRQHKSTQ